MGVEIGKNLLLFTDFVIIFSIILLIVTLVLFRIISHKKFTQTKQKLYGVFMSLDNTSLVDIATVIIYEAFTIYNIINIINFDLKYIFFYFILAIIYGIASLNIFKLIKSIFSHTLTFFWLYGVHLLVRYTVEVSVFWYIKAIVILGAIFLMLCSFYIAVSHIKDILSKNKYIEIEGVL